jgi:hypothetical protein
MFENLDKLFLGIIRPNENKMAEEYCWATALTFSEDAFFLGSLSCCYFDLGLILYYAADHPSHFEGMHQNLKFMFL